jgi:phosphoglycolate phosphatase-like HAD superfamily hydrolase
MQTAKNYGAAIGIGVTWGYRDAEELLSCGADTLANVPADILSALGL